jgi:hypothetical protein
MLDSKEQQAWVESCELYFPSQIRRSTDPVSLADEISLICDLKSFDALGPASEYLHRSSALLIGDSAVITAAFLPQVGTTNDFEHCLVELPLAGRSGTRFTIDNREWACMPGVQGMFLPGQAMSAHTAQPAFNLGFNLDPVTLEQHLMALAPELFQCQQARDFIQQPHPINLLDKRVHDIYRFLLNFLQGLTESPLTGYQVPETLIQSYEHVLYRATILMILPELILISNPRRA